MSESTCSTKGFRCETIKTKHCMNTYRGYDSFTRETVGEQTCPRFTDVTDNEIISNRHPEHSHFTS